MGWADPKNIEWFTFSSQPLVWYCNHSTPVRIYSIPHAIDNRLHSATQHVPDCRDPRALFSCHDFFCHLFILSRGQWTSSHCVLFYPPTNLLITTRSFMSVTQITKQIGVIPPFKKWDIPYVDGWGDTSACGEGWRRTMPPDCSQCLHRVSVGMF